MDRDAKKPIATSADGAGMEQASTIDQSGKDGTTNDDKDHDASAEDVAAKLGDFA